MKTEDGVSVSSTSVTTDKGVNILSYDVAFSEKGKVAFLKKNKMKLEPAKNGKTYLPKGAYTIELSGNGQKESVSFKIE